ncbi:cobalamin B12-binding domain-containing protein [Dethiosulfatarculus sandiegensis]|uniref:Methylmalonyl-CoA mutase n=1 Tax=Dethiosulfatarculus sandiegensis TaxID=1429043 RepID=A0A0D2HPD2_9BACT|nr:cobalamin B12-binding domain-containing protein [Dethiosulfatarculus sandiegensis]KIX12368.1 methylmalonyl-CoA mutase [Dethiosulfatarculus sandiegensis]
MNNALNQNQGKGRLRILVAKPGLDGHDRGAKVVAHALRDAGLEVIYSGLHQSVERIVMTALEESVDAIGLSIMSGAHLPICKRLMQALKEKGLTRVAVVVGGVIPSKDIEPLRKMGVVGVFPGGTPLPELAQGVITAIRLRQQEE